MTDQLRDAAIEYIEVLAQLMEVEERTNAIAPDHMLMRAMYVMVNLLTLIITTKVDFPHHITLDDQRVLVIDRPGSTPQAYIKES